MSLYRKIHLILALITMFSFVSCSENENMEVKIVNEPSEGDVLSREAKRGKQELEDGSLYEGEMVAGKPSGHGQRSYPNGDLYEGQFAKSMRHGHGTHRYKSDKLLERYVGMWANDEWDGYGKLVFKDSSRVEGMWNRSNLVYGDYEGADGEVRSGKWYGRWDKLEEGFSKNAFGAEYSGKFNQNGEYENGFIENPNGDLYCGDFFQNQYHGKGILEKADGTVYVGGFYENVYQGVGVLKESDGSMYSGQFQSGLPHGYGSQLDPSGVRYVGSWFNGVKNGSGTINFGDGSSYVGEFRNGLAIEGQYDWGDGKITSAYQDESGNWIDN